jgi:LPS O-antigen subunit length determinant protein (WzzB/FepE family)
MRERLQASLQDSCRPALQFAAQHAQKPACAPSAQERHLQDMPTSFWGDALKQLGIGAVLAAILIVYYQGESAKWEERQKIDEARWQQLFQQYTQDQSRALETIRACCQERNAILETRLGVASR